MTPPRRPGSEPSQSDDPLVLQALSSANPTLTDAAPASIPCAETATPVDSGPRSHRSEETSADGSRRAPETIRRFRVSVVEGACAGTTRESTSDRCSIGSHELNDLVVADATVSRFHCEIRITPEGALVTDLKSRNGTIVDGVQVREAFLRGGSLLRLGRVVVRFEFGVQRNPLALSPRDRFGSLVGASIPMRATFALLERAAGSDVTVLLEGETGTGKGKAAESIHQESARRKKPFIVIDCSAIHKNLLESELFGHEKGAFTGADARRIGAFEEASGGTVFLDEVGELPSDLQPKLLRVLENREFRRIGANRFSPLDVRVIAATNRDLRAEVNAGRFRSDLYFRLAVLKILIPPLRSRPGDIPTLVGTILESQKAAPEVRDRLLAPDFLADLQRGAWSGNVRELRNVIERCMVVEDDSPLFEDTEREGFCDPPSAPEAAGEVLPFAEAKRQAQAEFERRYLEALLLRFGGKVARAATAAGVDRVYLYRLLRRHGMKPGV